MSDESLSFSERLAWARWARMPSVHQLGRRLSGKALEDAKTEIKRLQGVIKEEHRRQNAPFADAFWD